MRILVRSRESLQQLAEADGVVAVVSISDDADDFPVVPPACDCRGVLRLRFDDVETDFDAFDQKRRPKAFTADQAREVAAFVVGLPKDIDSLVFQCELGMSRSAGMAAAVARWLGQDDLRFFKGHLPNRLVYRLTLEQIDPDCVHAGGGVICEECGKSYAEHRSHPAFPWMTVLCDGQNVKL